MSAIHDLCPTLLIAVCQKTFSISNRDSFITNDGMNERRCLDGDLAWCLASIKFPKLLCRLSPLIISPLIFFSSYRIELDLHNYEHAVEKQRKLCNIQIRTEPCKWDCESMKNGLHSSGGRAQRAQSNNRFALSRSEQCFHSDL